MSEENDMEDIQKLIDDMQAMLVELFDQFRELRMRLGQKPSNLVLSSTSGSSSSMEKPSIEDKPITKHISMESEEAQIKSSSSIPPKKETAEPDTKPDVRVSRLLDPISHELSTGSSPAEVIAEYLQAAKDELISKESQNDKVARDMDVVLKFLRARGRRSIRTEERDNILRRIKRWKAHLSK
ncbi:MAG: hypothetical protein ACFFDR_00790 [Candidatus Thorarchaeota archaeon]